MSPSVVKGNVYKALVIFSIPQLRNVFNHLRHLAKIPLDTTNLFAYLCIIQRDHSTVGAISLETGKSPTPLSPPVTLTQAELNAFFSSEAFIDINLTPDQRAHLTQLILNNFDHRKAYEAFSGKRYDSNRSCYLRRNPRFRLAVSLLQKFLLARSAEISQWQKDQSIQDSRAQIARCDVHIEELNRKEDELKKVLVTADQELKNLTEQCDKAVENRIPSREMKELMLSRKLSLERCAKLESMLHEINAELRKWLKAREFWKENVDTVAGLRREGGGATASAAIYADLSKASNEDVMKLAQARVLNENRRN